MFLVRTFLFLMNFFASAGKGKESEENFIKLMIIMVNLVTSATKGNMLNEMQQETSKDQFILQLMEFITNRFPQKIEKFLNHLHRFWNFRDEISIQKSVSTMLEIMYTG